MAVYEQSFNPYEKNLSVIKGYFRRPAVLLAGVARAAAALLTFIGTILIVSRFSEVLDYLKEYFLRMCDKADAPADVREGIIRCHEDLSSSGISSSFSSHLSSLLLAGLICAAFLIIWIRCRDAAPGASPRPGFTILYVLAIIHLIGTIVAAVAVCIVNILLFVYYSRLSSGGGSLYDEKDFTFIRDLYDRFPPLKENESSIVLGVAVALLTFTIIAFAVILIRSIGRVRFYSSIRKSLSSVELYSKGALTFGVTGAIGMVFRATCALSMFSVLFMGSVNGKKNPFIGFAILMILAELASAFALYLEFRIAMGYKKRIFDVKYGYSNSAEEPAAPYAPFSAPVQQEQPDLSFTEAARPAPDDANPYQAPAAEVADNPVCAGDADDAPTENRDDPQP